ncbi:MAG TPA: hypothetical protein VEU96_29305 [Bryobacteraceae bacterium]|nr:hypothetical protein [Bryobacteraceae bacterium]
MVTQAKRIGVAVALACGAVLLWRGLLILAAAVAMTVAGLYLGHVWRRLRAVRRFRAVWQAQGKDLLLVYSNSPNWKHYVEEKWLPRWGNRAVVLNWSERQNWQRERRPEVALFRVFAGDREFNPLGIVVPQKGRSARVFRFWHAFREYRHGKDRLLRAAEAQLEAYLDAAVQRGA